MGWERLTIPRCGAIVDAAAKGFPASMELPRNPSVVWGITGASQTSDNHESTAWSAELARASVWGTAAEYEAARTVVLWWIDQELRVVGLWRHEQCSSAPHGGMHLDALVTLGCALLAGRAKQDAELGQAFNRLFMATVRALASGATPGGSVLLPGERDPGGPVSPQATGFWRELRGLAHKGAMVPMMKRLRRGAPNWSGDFWVCVRGIQVLAGSYVHQGVIADGRFTQLATLQTNPLPFLRRPMTVQRWSGGHLATLARPSSFEQRGIAGVCDWVLVDHNKQDGAMVFKSAGVDYGLEWSKEPPTAPRGAVELESPRRAA